MTTFSPPIPPSYGSKMKRMNRVLKAPFGDGYEQRARDGVNFQGETWNLIWNNLSDADVLTIMEFFDDLASVDPFSWTTPLGDTINFICEDYERTFNSYGANVITATCSKYNGS